MMTSTQAYTAAAVGGAVLWQATAMLTGRREAWDAGSYWVIAYPLAIALAGILAYAHPDRPWRFALAIMWVQPLVMVVTSGSDFSMLPLGLILFAILALPLIGVAAAVVAVRRREASS